MATDWGRVHFNRQQEAWCVEGIWQGERHYFSRYQTALGPRTCQTEREAKLLQIIISSEIANGLQPSPVQEDETPSFEKLLPGVAEESQTDLGLFHFQGIQGRSQSLDHPETRERVSSGLPV